MIIKSDQINTGASRNYFSSRVSFTRHDAWNTDGSLQFSLINSESEHSSSRSQSKNGSAQNLMEQMNASTGARRLSISESFSNLRRLRQQTLSYLLDMLFGRRSRMNFISDASDRSGSFSELISPENSGNYGAGESYYSAFYYSEQETACFDAKGTAVTADGREIPFHISLEMSRSFTQIAEQQIEIGKPRLCDPLVVNLSGNGAEVTDQKFFFDIDADGTEEEISSLGSGSGYLALDLNGNGVIDDGSELFGTASGNGFADLAAYDRDKNGWIDEADEIFSKLRIWVINEDGNNELLSLADAGVGAICLRHENTEFSINSAADNHTKAVVRQSGFFLYEDGRSGTVQQLDLAT